MANLITLDDVLSGYAEGRQPGIEETEGGVSNIYGFNPLNYAAFSHDDYERFPGHFSVTTLLSDFRHIVLESRYYDQIEQDVAEMLWSRVGVGCHLLREQAVGRMDTDVMVEKRYRRKVEEVWVTGQIDAYFPGQGKLDDFKVTRMWTIYSGVRDEEYIKQLSFYKWLLEGKDKEEWDRRKQQWIPAPYPYPVKQATISFLVRDYKESEFVMVKGKPKVKHIDISPSPLLEKPMDLWPADVSEAWLKEKIERLKVYLDMDDDRLPLCENRWYNDARCKKYCSIRKICNFGKKYQR